MGVDTGGALHAVILRLEERREEMWQLVHLAVCHEFSELDALVERFRVGRCVIDGLPETHATRAFAKRHGGAVYMCFFNDSQRGEPAWNHGGFTVQVNRTEALDASRAAVRERKLTLPSRTPIVEAFAHHLTADAKILEEDEETGAKRYRYVRTGEDHFSLALTYALIAGSTWCPWWAVACSLDE